MSKYNRWIVVLAGLVCLAYALTFFLLPDKVSDGSKSAKKAEVTIRPSEDSELKVLEGQLPAETDEALLLEIESALKEQDMLGESDSLSLKNDASQVGNKTYNRLEQRHRNIPVYGTEIVTVREDNTIERISGKTEEKIPENIDVSPRLNAEQALEAYRAINPEMSINADENDPALYLYKKDDVFSLVWKMRLSLDQLPYSILLSASDGSAQLKVPLFSD